MKSISQSEHERINAREYPGTRQLCDVCNEPTGRCEDDTITCDYCGRTLCEDCSIQKDLDEVICKICIRLTHMR
jgi:hypothetical protein